MLTIAGRRKYLTSPERERFRRASEEFNIEIQLFCCVLLETGCRISEALNLLVGNFDLDDEYLYISSLKKRKKGIYRRVPIAPDTVELFNNFCEQKFHNIQPKRYDRLWTWSRMTGYRHVRKVMELAGIEGPQASPKGLRHGFAVAALEAGVPMNLVQRWLGHTHWQTTAIYADFVGAEERGFAERLWSRPLMRPENRLKHGKISFAETPEVA